MSPFTVEANVVVVVDVHADLTDLELCWGDGDCTLFPVLTPQVNPLWGVKTYQFSALHTYSTTDSFTVFVSHCCYDDDLYNLVAPGNSLVQIETMMVLQESDWNTTPGYGTEMVFAGMAQSAMGLPGTGPDPEGDEFVVSFCDPLNAIEYVFPDELIPGPSDELILDPVSGEIIWNTPVLEGLYLVQTCTEEFREGTLISRSHRLVCFLVGGYPTAIRSVKEAGVIVYPNPVTAGELFLKYPHTLGATISCILLYKPTHQLVLEREYTATEDVIAISMHELGPGHYFLILETANGMRWYQPVVKLE